MTQHGAPVPYGEGALALQTRTGISRATGYRAIHKAVRVGIIHVSRGAPHALATGPRPAVAA